MSSRRIPEGFAPDAVAEIDARLDRVAEQCRVALPLAIESGSRAWGFPSPDSDYDCRFVFVRSPDAYLTPWPQRDVIETPLTPVLDVNGWDLVKAIKLLVRGNAVIVEWLTSPIVYRADPEFRSAFLTLAEAIGDRGSLARHYLHVGQRYRAEFADGLAVKQKRIFYALRPAAVLRWLRVNPQRGAPPMDLPTLLDGCDAHELVRRTVEDLIRRKAESAELGEAPLPPVVAGFIDEELEAARHDAAATTPHLLSEDERKDLAAQFFRSTVRRLHRGGGQTGR